MAIPDEFQYLNIGDTIFIKTKQPYRYVVKKMTPQECILAAYYVEDSLYNRKDQVISAHSIWRWSSLQRNVDHDKTIFAIDLSEYIL